MKKLREILIHRSIFLGFIVLIAVISIEFIGVRHLRSQSLSNARVTANILADYFEPTIMFESIQDFDEIVKKLDFDNVFYGVTVYGIDDKVFATKGETSLVLPKSDVQFVGNKVVAKAMIKSKGKKIGTLVISQSIDELDNIIKSEIASIAVLILSMLLVFLYFVSSLSKKVSDPINKLIGELNDYVNTGSIFDQENYDKDQILETKDLRMAFGHLFTQIRKSQDELEEFNRSLENKVKEKTKELQNALDDTKKYQKKVIAQEKLASLGSLSAGIAHELKNPLNLINNSALLVNSSSKDIAEMLKKSMRDEKSEEKEEVMEELEDITTACNIIYESGVRADRIIKSMLSQSRSEKSELVDTDLSELCKRALNLSFHAMRAKPGSITVDIDESVEDNIFLKCYPDELERAIINMLDNSFDALKDKKAADSSFSPKIMLKLHNGPKEIEITVEDNGIGIPEDIKEKILEPFFTTKDTGKGTGLGMSMINDIVIALNGDIKIDSKVNELTRIKLVLPKIDGDLHVAS